MILGRWIKSELGVGDQVFYESDIEHLLRRRWRGGVAKVWIGGALRFANVRVDVLVGGAIWISGGLCDGVVPEVMVGCLD